MGSTAGGTQKFVLVGGEGDVHRHRDPASQLLPVALRFDQHHVVHAYEVDLASTAADEFAGGKYGYGGSDYGEDKFACDLLDLEAPRDRPAGVGRVEP